MWPRAAHTADGVAYRVRPISRDDANRERDFIANLSPESRYYRLMFSMREPPPNFVAQLVDIDMHRSMALVAVTGEPPDEQIIGVARYAADDNDLDCEVAIVVADEWQCRGIGTTLTELLFEYAAHEGFRSIYGHVLASNQRMLKHAEWLGLTIGQHVAGQSTVRVARQLKAPDDRRMD